MDFDEKIKEVIKKNELFDEEYYLSQFENFDSTLSPLNHYLTKGYLENKNPSRKFNTKFYLSENLDVKKTGINPLIHYCLFGMKEEREINYKNKPLKNRLITKEIFDEKLGYDTYYKDRWEYLGEVVDILKEMDDVDEILEFGPYKSPLVEFEDVIDITDEYEEFYPLRVRKVIKHNCSEVPYPIKDKTYDLVIACQVFEHLGINGEQIKIFDEVERISKRLVITLPYKWFIPQLRDHHMITKKVIDFWARNRKPTFEQVYGSRILRIYDFD